MSLAEKSQQVDPSWPKFRSNFAPRRQWSTPGRFGRENYASIFLVGSTDRIRHADEYLFRMDLTRSLERSGPQDSHIELLSE